MKYMTVKEAAQKWGISARLAQQLCTSGRVKGANKFGGAWAIPADAEKPGDPRRSTNAGEAEAQGSSNEASPEGTRSEAHIAMPLLNTPFKPGHCMESIVEIDDHDQRNIALAEYYYFSGQVEKASDIAEQYLMHEELSLSLSASWIYAYANLALDRIQQVRATMERVKMVLSTVNEDSPMIDRALAVSISTAASVLLHLPLPKILEPLKTYIHMLPPGLRLFILYVEAHHSYLNKQYGASIGIAETALALEGEIYPIPTIYLHLVATMGYINLRQPEQARTHLLEAWEIARADDLIEAFGEHHGLLGGVLEATLKKEAPEDFRRIIAITYKFSAGWRKIHNPDTGHNVADNLTTTEFAAAMLAARDWTNKEIAAHMGISENTVKNYIAVALQKLNISQRKDLKDFMLK